MESTEQRGKRSPGRWRGPRGSGSDAGTRACKGRTFPFIRCGGLSLRAPAHSSSRLDVMGHPFTVTASSKPGTSYPARGREGRAHTCVCRVTPVHWHVGSKCTGKHAEGAELSQGTEQEMSRQTGANSQPQPHAGTEVRSTRHQTHRGTLHGPRDTSPHLAHAGGALRPPTLGDRALPTPPPASASPSSFQKQHLPAVLEADATLSANESTYPRMGGRRCPVGLQGTRGRSELGHPRWDRGEERGWFSYRNTAPTPRTTEPRSGPLAGGGQS